MTSGPFALWTWVSRTRPLFRRSVFIEEPFGCHPEPETNPDCLAGDIAPRAKLNAELRTLGLLLKRHSQSAAFQAPPDQGGTGEPPRQHTLLPGLVMVYI